jgi:hypothetical protein
MGYESHVDTGLKLEGKDNLEDQDINIHNIETR